MLPVCDLLIFLLLDFVRSRCVYSSAQGVQEDELVEEYLQPNCSVSLERIRFKASRGRRQHTDLYCESRLFTYALED